MKKILLAILIVVVVGGLAFCAYMGVFTNVVVEEREQGPYTLVYREMKGNDMKQVADITTALETFLSERGVSSRKPMGIYYPDGRAEIGFVVEGAPPEQLVASASEAKIRQTPVVRSMVASFPWHNKFSFVVGYMKAEPAFVKYREAHGYVQVEAYVLLNGDEIVYMQPVVQK